MMPLRKPPAIIRLPIMRVLERLATVFAFALLVYLLGVLITILEVWHRPPSHWRAMGAGATGHADGGLREYRRALPVVAGQPCVLVIHGAQDIGLISSRMVCGGRVCVETDLKINRRGQVVCTPERVSR